MTEAAALYRAYSEAQAGFTEMHPEQIAMGEILDEQFALSWMAAYVQTRLTDTVPADQMADPSVAIDRALAAAQRLANGPEQAQLSKRAIEQTRLIGTYVVARELWEQDAQASTLSILCNMAGLGKTMEYIIAPNRAHVQPLRGDERLAALQVGLQARRAFFTKTAHLNFPYESFITDLREALDG